MAKRKHGIRGAGSVYLRKDGRYAAEIKLDGKRKTVYGKTEKEAYQKMQQALYEHRQGTLITGPQQTVKQFLEYWLENVQKPLIREITYSLNRGIIYKHIMPDLGQIKLRDLKPEHIEKLYAKMLKAEYNPSSIGHTHGILRSALNQAVKRGLLARNVCDIVSPPRSHKHEVTSLTINQAQKLIQVAKGHRLEALLIVAITTGMRRGELLALRWQDVDFETKRLYVRRSVNRIVGHGIVEGEPKTMNSKRTITLPQVVLDALKQHKANQEETKRKVGTLWKDRNLVFPNTQGNYEEATHLRTMFLKFLRDAELPSIRFHDLRHSAASILLSLGVNPKVIQELLGHSKVSMTLDVYSHVLPGMQSDAMDKWNDLM
ncbi:MAG TPA: tyrosine-type recombinase/integrase [Ktedonobacteraceae bacterium]|nr:tyrosine-type recombinase/integrase [Ktedonobacteraceae bacterium]